MDLPQPVTESVDPRFAELDAMSTLQIVRLMNDEDLGVPAAIRPALPAIAGAIDAIVDRLRRGGRLVYAGAGTSGRLAMLDAVECVPTFSVPPTLVTTLIAGGTAAMTRSIEGVEDDAEAGRDDVAGARVSDADAVVGLAASGGTTYVVAVLEEARRRGALTVALANTAPAAILEVADHPIAVVTGPEVLAGSTRLKAGTSQKLVLNMISTTAMVSLGKVYGNRMVDVAVTNQKLRRRAEVIVADIVGCERHAAADLLDAAGGEVKTAVLMGLQGVDAAIARARIEQAAGSLRAAIQTIQES